MIIFLISPYSFTVPGGDANFRVTVLGDFRITASGDFRVLASAPAPEFLTIDTDTITMDTDLITIDMDVLGETPGSALLFSDGTDWTDGTGWV